MRRVHEDQCSPDIPSLLSYFYVALALRFRGGPLLLQECARPPAKFIPPRWSETVFAERFARVITGDIPSDWIVPPEQVRYLHGLGLEEKEAQRIIGGLVEGFGPGALRVDHVPQLREKLVSFGRGSPADY